MPTLPARLADFWLPVLELARASFSPDATDPPEVLASRLVAALDAAAARAAEHGFRNEQIEAARFAVVAWVDETAMTRDWPGAGTWRLAPLQRRYFSTTRAGVEFFERLDALDDADTASREVYGLMMVAGFAGQYSARPAGELATRRRQLLERIQAEGGMLPVSVDSALFPAARATAQPAARRRVREWLLPLLVILLPLATLVAIYVVMDASLARLAATLMPS